MPTYNFRNTETGEIIERFMKIAEKEAFLTINPVWEVTHLSPAAMSYTAAGQRVHSGFKETISKIQERTGQKIQSQFF